jgi:hypothetical protein
MPKCRKCGSVIDELRLTVRNYSYHKVALDDEGKLTNIADEGTYNGTTFRCPKCWRYIFNSTKQATKFLKKGTRPDTKTKW